MQSCSVAAIEWRQLLGADDGYELSPDAGAGEIAAVEAALEAVFPEQLREVYQTSNGVFDQGLNAHGWSATGNVGYHHELGNNWFVEPSVGVIWPLEMLAQENMQRREVGVLPADLIAFGDDGTGDPFCVPRDGSDGVFYWSPIDGEATLLAGAIADFWSGWVAGTLPPH